MNTLCQRETILKSKSKGPPFGGSSLLLFKLLKTWSYCDRQTLSSCLLSEHSGQHCHGTEVEREDKGGTRGIRVEDSDVGREPRKQQGQPSWVGRGAGGRVLAVRTPPRPLEKPISPKAHMCLLVGPGAASWKTEFLGLPGGWSS